MKKTLKLIPAIVMLLVSAILVSTASYAWFSMNNKVTVTGMTVKAHVDSSLLIADDTLASTAKKADENFQTSLEQTVSAILEPVSTSTGLTFFYTVDAKADGSKQEAVASVPYIQYDASAAASDTTNYSDKFSEVYGVSKTTANTLITGKDRAVAYVDYVFQLKATNTSDSVTKYIDLTKLDLTYAGTTDANVAYRVAIFVEDISSGTANAAPGTLKGTYKPSTAANHEGKVVSGTATYATASYVSSAVTLASINTQTTGYYKVVVRLYIEGQDTTCTNTTFAALTDSWALELDLSLVDTVAGVTAITMKTTPVTP